MTTVPAAAQELVLYAKHSQKLSRPAAGKPWPLRDWATYALEGPEDQVALVVERLGSRVCTPRTPTSAQLQFRNELGYVDAGPLGLIEVTTDKFTAGDFDTLLAEITRRSAALPFAAATTSAVPFDRTLAADDDLLYHAFVYLRHIVGTPLRLSKELLGPLRSILARPHRRPHRRRRMVPVGMARQVGPAVLLDVATGRYPMQRAPASAVASKLRGMLPVEVDDSVLAMDVDTTENQFIKAALDLFLSIARRMLEVSEAQTSDMSRVSAACRHIEATLRPIRQHPLWQEVGTMTHFPASSTVLQRRHDYRAVFQHYNLLRLASRFPLASPDVRRLLDVKDIARLYELWCFFAVVDAVSSAIGREPSAAKRMVERSDLQASVRHSTAVSWGQDVVVTYNPTFSRLGEAWRRSYSVQLRPDILVEIRTDDGVDRHVFDAKFKVTWAGLSDDSEAVGATGTGDFQTGDVHAMHTYRDALKLKSAWVLYPGTEFRFFGVDGSCATRPESLAAVPNGVGACPLGVGGLSASLLSVLNRF